jgi:hypothetical protein
MAFDWQSFLEIADELAARDDEAAWRTAISRAYYTALGVATEALPAAERATVNPRNAHERIWQLYTFSTTAGCRSLGNLGYRLRGRRRIADYNAGHSVQERDAQQAVHDAHQLLASIDRHGYQP